MADSTVSNRFKKASVALIGIGIFALHAALLYFSSTLFNILISTYIIAYAIFVLILVSKNKSCLDGLAFNWLLNLSIYTIFLQGILVLFALAMGFFKSSKS